MTPSADVRPIIQFDDRVAVAAHLVGNHGFDEAERIMLVSMEEHERVDTVQERLAS